MDSIYAVPVVKSGADKERVVGYSVLTFWAIILI